MKRWRGAALELPSHHPRKKNQQQPQCSNHKRDSRVQKYRSTFREETRQASRQKYDEVETLMTKRRDIHH
jgi:hypothetical protein